MDIREVHRMRIALTGVWVAAECSCVVLYAYYPQIFELLRNLGLAMFAILALYLSSMVYLDSKVRNMRAGIRHRFDDAESAVIDAILRGKQTYADIEKEALKARRDVGLTKGKVLTAFSNLLQIGYVESHRDRYRLSERLLEYMRT